VDLIQIRVNGGRGGCGHVHFAREPFRPIAPPDVSNPALKMNYIGDYMYMNAQAQYELNKMGKLVSINREVMVAVGDTFGLKLVDR
jgi:GTPase involved in cell partitioning and DNA repair